MRDKDKSCKKGKESTIGKIIYGFLLFMPLIAIGVTCVYAMFNKNAYQSYGDYIDTSTTEVNINSQLINGQTYTINYTGENLNTDGYDYYVLNNQTNIYNLFFENEQEFFVDHFRLIVSANRSRLYVYDTNGITHSLINWNELATSFYFVSTGQNSYGTANTYYTITTLSYTNGKLSDIFYYSINKVEKSNLFNWVENNAIYTGIQNTCETLSITNTFIPLLLTYWLIISVLYFLYDIILMILHMLHRKIHELQDSI